MTVFFSCCSYWRRVWLLRRCANWMTTLVAVAALTPRKSFDTLQGLHTKLLLMFASNNEMQQAFARDTPRATRNRSQSSNWFIIFVIRSKVTHSLVACYLLVSPFFCGMVLFLLVYPLDFLDFLCCRDKSSGFQLYQSDPSGNYAGWTVGQRALSCFQCSSKTRMYFDSQLLSYFCCSLCFWLLRLVINQAAQAVLKSEYAPNMSNAARKLPLKF